MIRRKEEMEKKKTSIKRVDIKKEGQGRERITAGCLIPIDHSPEPP